jgi:hypothetical protein
MFENKSSDEALLVKMAEIKKILLIIQLKDVLQVLSSD